MEKAVPLSPQQVQEQLTSTPGWAFENDKIKKEFKFNDFMDALSLINKLAPFCEAHDHHPDIHIFYNKILFELQRFDIGGKVTDKDFAVAHEIERLYAARS